MGKDPFGSVREQLERGKLDALRDLEPESSALSASHWKVSTSTDMRRKISFAARIRTVGESWDTVARVLDYDSAETAKRAIVKGHPEEWEAEQPHAHKVIQRNYLPKRAIQGLLSCVNMFTEETYKTRGIEYKDAASVAIRASNAATKMIKTVNTLSEEEGDKVFDEVTEKNIKGLQSILNEMATTKKNDG